MDPNSGELYTDTEVEAMTPEERAKLVWISQQEFNQLRMVVETERPTALKRIRNAEKAKNKRRRQHQKLARRKNRNR